MAVNERDARIYERKDTISKLNEVIHSQNEQIASLRISVDNGNITIENLNEQIAYLTKKLFGSSSEKRNDLIGQLNLFDEVEQETVDITLPIEETVKTKSVRKHRRTITDTFKGIPLRKEVMVLSQDERFCPDCETPLERIGEEMVRREFRFTPAKGEVVEFYKEPAEQGRRASSNTHVFGVLRCAA